MIKIRNKTHWRTDHLRAFVDRVAADELDPAKRRGLIVEFRYGRGFRGGSSGHATLGGSRCVVRLISGKRLIQPDKVDLAGVLAHELAHLRGMTHEQMRGAPRYRRVGNHRELYAWAAALPLDRRPATVKPTLAEKRQRELARAESMAAHWSSCADEARREAVRAEKRARGWARRAREIARRLDRAREAAAGPPPGGGGVGGA